MKKNFLTVLVIFIAITISLLLLGCSKTVATVNNIKIKQSEVDAYINFLKKQNPDILLPENKEDLKALEATIIDSLIVTRLLEKYADENNITISKEEVEERFNQIVESYPSIDDFENELEQKGITRELLKKELRDQILREKIFIEVTKDVSVGSEEIRKYYDENKETLFKVPEKIRVSHILVKFSDENDTEENTSDKVSREDALNKIKYIQEQLNNGEDFENLAGKYSDDKLSSENGGDIGYVSKGQLIEELEKVAFSLKVGEVSDIVETPYGFHILKVTDSQQEYIKDFEEVKDSIENYLENVNKKEKWGNFIYNLMEEADIKYYIDKENS